MEELCSASVVGLSGFEHGGVLAPAEAGVRPVVFSTRFFLHFSHKLLVLALLLLLFPVLLVELAEEIKVLGRALEFASEVEVLTNQLPILLDHER